MKRFFELLILALVAVAASSCNIDDVVTTALPPKIILDSESGIYTVKQGREIVIAPNYESAEGASFRWTMDGQVLSTSPSLLFMREVTGAYYITLNVTTEGGSDEEEIRLDVLPLEIPTITIAGVEKETVAVGAVLKFSASVRDTGLPTSLRWSLNGEEVGSELSYTFTAEEVGSYTLTATATNEDGSHSDTVIVEVLKADDIPFVWEFENYTRHSVVGRKLLLAPSAVSGEEHVQYLWTMEGSEEPLGHQARLIFSAAKAGVYRLTATATIEKADEKITLNREFSVTFYDEGAFYRAKNGDSAADWSHVYAYTPAPGQFINELKTGGFDGTQTTPEAACAYAERRLTEGVWVSLGGFGGYIVVGFDHSIDNVEGAELAVIGNAFDGSSEPGIVWVMQDENGNKEPDDTWYELKGSESDVATTLREYAVTYYRPSGAGMAVQWRDNLGNSGEIDYLKQFHNQDFYYPLWIADESYTLVGTRLEARNYDQSGNGSYWVQPHYDWGYVDNFSPTDFLAADKSNRPDVGNAIDIEGSAVQLAHIDFVKIQCAVNAKSGWLGELSTEVCGIYDCTIK